MIENLKRFELVQGVALFSANTLYVEPENIPSFFIGPTEGTENSRGVGVFKFCVTTQ